MEFSFIIVSTTTNLTEYVASSRASQGRQAETVESTYGYYRFSIPMVPRDKKGKPMLPLNVGIMTVISLGTVCMRVGYEVTRQVVSW